MASYLHIKAIDERTELFACTAVRRWTIRTGPLKLILISQVTSGVPAEALAEFPPSWMHEASA